MLTINEHPAEHVACVAFGRPAFLEFAFTRSRSSPGGAAS